MQIGYLAEHVIVEPQIVEEVFKLLHIWTESQLPNLKNQEKGGGMQQLNAALKGSNVMTS
jgi:hypothetical protein